MTSERAININDSIFLITSSDTENEHFGTAFAFHRDEQGTYFLTCRHVVTDVGGSDKARISNWRVEMVGSGSDSGLDDLAVLRIDHFSEMPVLTLDVSGEKESSASVRGFQRFGNQYMLRPLVGRLGEQIMLEARQGRERVLAWDLRIEGDYGMQRGYSGAPVIDEQSGDCIAVATHRIGENRGVAISVKTLDKVWPGKLQQIQSGYSVNRICRAIVEAWEDGLDFVHERVHSEGVKFVTPALAKQYHVSPLKGFPAIGYLDLTLMLPDRVREHWVTTMIKQLAYRVRGHWVFAIIKADGLTLEDITALVARFPSLVEFLRPEHTKFTKVLELGTLVVVFDNDHPEELVQKIKGLKEQRNLSSYVVDFSRREYRTDSRILDWKLLYSLLEGPLRWVVMWLLRQSLRSRLNLRYHKGHLSDPKRTLKWGEDTEVPFSANEAEKG